ncbi:dTMP kinase [Corynebacterium auris]|uniref:dTMP kinase n=1 Tax=Corynebacterium auris TaxID=44750 RepID=UPI0025B5F780|nr:dTMP kinase [Corynebacterium auris]WJY67489.1 Thymidylate kinase [Corynebacterium auris]
MIIAIEGIDGAGKNTLSAQLCRAVRAESLSFPRYGASIHADLARDALHGRMGDLTESAYGMATLFALDRAGAKQLLDAYAGAPDRTIVLDRYVASNAAYTAARTGDPAAAEWVHALEFERLGLPRPDLQVLVDTPPEEAGRRAQRREQQDTQRARDRYERDTALQQRTFAAYEELAARNWAGRWVRTTQADTIIQAVENL